MAHTYHRDSENRPLCHHGRPIACGECVAEDEAQEAAPAVSDGDVVLRFRSLAQKLEAEMPDETERERRSRVVTMLLRAAIESIVAHLGPGNARTITHVMGAEASKAIADEVVRLQKSVTPN